MSDATEDVNGPQRQSLQLRKSGLADSLVLQQVTDQPASNQHFGMQTPSVLQTSCMRRASMQACRFSELELVFMRVLFIDEAAVASVNKLLGEQAAGVSKLLA